MKNFKSYVEFEAFGVYCGDFIDELVASQHYVFDITAESDIYYIKTAPHNYPQIVKKARSFGVKTKVVARSGLYFSLRRNRRRLGIPLGVLAFFGLIVLMSNFIWDIRIEGNDRVSSYRIMEQLDRSGIRTGIGIHSFDANLAELELALALEGLAWVSIERSGSRINVKVSERLGEIGDVSDIPVNRPANVVSSHSGQLIRADVYRGELLYEIGSGVNAGDVVVSGIIGRGAVNDVNGVQISPPTSYHHVHADAVLIVEVSEIADFYQPFTVLHRASNGREVNNSSIVFLGRRLGGELDIPPHADHVDYSERIYTPTVFGVFPLPFRVLEQDYVFYDRVRVTDTPSEARRQLDRQIELYESNFILSHGEQTEIVERHVEYFPDCDGVGALVRFVFRVDAAEKREIMVG
jgi:similar to stage IV sporulation protein